jgi:hypothetical protein
MPDTDDAGIYVGLTKFEEEDISALDIMLNSMLFCRELKSKNYKLIDIILSSKNEELMKDFKKLMQI